MDYLASTSIYISEWAEQLWQEGYVFRWVVVRPRLSDMVVEGEGQ